MNSKLCQTAEMELFPRVVAGFFRGERRILPYTLEEIFAKIVNNKKPFTIFLQKLASWMFDNVLNMLLNWLPKITIFHF